MSMDYALTALLERSISSEKGDGSGSETAGLLDETNVRSHDERSLARTWISIEDVPPDRRDKWRRIINEWHDGQSDPDKGSANWRAGKLNDARLFASHLGLSEPERDKVVEMADEIDFTKFGSFKTEQVLVACCSLVRDENTEEYGNRIILQDEFRELMDVTGLGSSQHRKIRQAIRERTDYF